MTSITSDRSTARPPSPPNVAGAVFYRMIWRWHFYAGLFCIPFILTLAISGSIYLFKPQIEAWQNRAYQNLTISGPRSTANQQITAALAAVPESQFVNYRLPENLNQAVVITVNKRGDAQQVYINPYSLAVLNVSQVSSQIIQLVRTFHGELLAGTFGSILVELAGCWAIVLLVSGLYLWWPRSARGLAGALYPRLREGSRTFWRDIHAVVGIWIAACALFLLITGLPWALVWGTAFKEIRQLGNDQNVSSQTHVQPHTEHQHAPGSMQIPSKQDWTINRSEAKDLLQSESVEQVNLPEQVLQQAQSLQFAPPVELSTSPDNERMWAVKSQSQNRTLRADALLNADGQVKINKPFSERSTIDKVVGIGVAAHEGQLFGWFNQLLGLLTALGLVMMCVSGFILWRRRKPAHGLGAPPALSNARAGKGVAIIILLLALVLPLLAISLLCLLLSEWLVLRRFAASRIWLGLNH